MEENTFAPIYKDDKIELNQQVLDTDCNFNLLDDMTTEKLLKYVNLLNVSCDDQQENNIVHQNNQNKSSYDFHSILPMDKQISTQNSNNFLVTKSTENDVMIPHIQEGHSNTMDPLLSQQWIKMNNKIDPSSVITEEEYCPFTISKPENDLLVDDGIPISALSEELSASHGSGGIVTIRKRTTNTLSKIQRLTESFDSVFESLNYVSNIHEQCKEKTISSQSLEDLLISPSTSIGSFDHSKMPEYEEDIDDFDWNKLL